MWKIFSYIKNFAIPFSLVCVKYSYRMALAGNRMSGARSEFFALLWFFIIFIQLFQLRLSFHERITVCAQGMIDHCLFRL